MKKIFWGEHTKKAYENFPFKEKTFPFEFIKSLALIKASAIKSAMELNLIDKEKGRAIYKIALKISKGKYKDQFPLSIFQTGSGTSTNMNMNEVISNLATKTLKGKPVHPNDDVNICQSSNDVIPSATYLSLLFLSREKLLKEIKELEREFKEKAEEYKEIITVGRTHIQDAVPLGLGYEFLSYYYVIKKQRKNIEYALKRLLEIPLGGTAVGTGLNSHPEFAKKAIFHLSKLTGFNLKYLKYPLQNQFSIGNLSIFSSSLKNLSLELFKILQDLKFKNYFGEIKLKPLQAGSSIMPGKVNPVALEVLQQICFYVAGKDTSLSLSALSGNFELNTFFPLSAYNLIESIKYLSKGIEFFREKALKAMEANKDLCYHLAINSPAIGTPLSLYLGYDKTAEIVRKAMEGRKSVFEVIKEENILSNEELEKIFDIKKLAYPFGNK